MSTGMPFSWRMGERDGTLKQLCPAASAPCSEQTKQQVTTKPDMSETIPDLNACVRCVKVIPWSCVTFYFILFFYIWPSSDGLWKRHIPSKVSGRTWLCDSVMFATLPLSTGQWTTKSPEGLRCLFLFYCFPGEISLLTLTDEGGGWAVLEWQNFVLHLSPNRCIAVIQGPIEDCYQM